VQARVRRQRRRRRATSSDECSECWWGVRECVAGVPLDLSESTSGVVTSSCGRVRARERPILTSVNSSPSRVYLCARASWLPARDDWRRRGASPVSCDHLVSLDINVIGLSGPNILKMEVIYIGACVRVCLHTYVRRYDVCGRVGTSCGVRIARFFLCSVRSPFSCALVTLHLANARRKASSTESFRSTALISNDILRRNLTRFFHLIVRDNCAQKSHFITRKSDNSIITYFFPFE